MWCVFFLFWWFLDTFQLECQLGDYLKQPKTTLIRLGDNLCNFKPAKTGWNFLFSRAYFNFTDSLISFHLNRLCAAMCSYLCCFDGFGLFSDSKTILTPVKWDKETRLERLGELSCSAGLTSNPQSTGYLSSTHGTITCILLASVLADMY